MYQRPYEQTGVSVADFVSYFGLNPWFVFQFTDWDDVNPIVRTQQSKV